MFYFFYENAVLFSNVFFILKKLSIRAGFFQNVFQIIGEKGETVKFFVKRDILIKNGSQNLN